MENIIREAYYDPLVGFVGMNKLYHKLKSYGITREQINDFLQKQEVYQTTKKNNQSRNSFIPRYPLQEFQIDLIYIDNPHLNQSKYGFCCIDVFTKKADIQLMSRKQNPKLLTR